MTVDLATIDDYKARLAAWQESLADLAAKRRASYVPISSDLPLADLVFAELRRRRVVGLTLSFLAPLALAGLLFLPVVVAMYLLKLRRDEAVVPSTLLWQKLVADVEANAPWQKLRRSLLLLLQLLLVADPRDPRGAPVPRAAGGPRRRPRPRHRHLGVDGGDRRRRPTRLDAAKAAADRRAQGPPGGRQGERDRGGTHGAGRRERHRRPRRVKQAIAAIPPTSDVGDLGDALRLASALAARSGDAEILVATDAAARDPAQGDRRRAGPRPPGGPRRAQPGDRRARRPDRARAASRTPRSCRSPTSASSGPSGGSSSTPTASCASRASLTLDPQRRPTSSSTTSTTRPSGVGHRGPARPPGRGRDRRARTRSRSTTGRGRSSRRSGCATILLVGDGDPYLETALSYLPDTELYGVDRPRPSTARTTKPELFDLIIFEGYAPGRAAGEARSSRSRRRAPRRSAP